MQAFQIALESFARASGVALSTVALAGSSRSSSPTSWRRGSRAARGKSLASTLAAKPVVVASADPADRTATDGFAPTKLARPPARAVAPAMPRSPASSR